MPVRHDCVRVHGSTIGLGTVARIRRHQRRLTWLAIRRRPWTRWPSTPRSSRLFDAPDQDDENVRPRGQHDRRVVMDPRDVPGLVRDDDPRGKAGRDRVVELLSLKDRAPSPRLSLRRPLSVPMRSSRTSRARAVVVLFNPLSNAFCPRRRGARASRPRRARDGAADVLDAELLDEEVRREIAADRDHRFDSCRRVSVLPTRGIDVRVGIVSLLSV